MQNLFDNKAWRAYTYNTQVYSMHIPQVLYSLHITQAFTAYRTPKHVHSLHNIQAFPAYTILTSASV